MFEFSVACKYLIPRWRQLSVSIISVISVLVISLVVWLILVFFSVTNGLESNWIEKLVAMTAPVRMTPTQAYYDSYYYQIDSISDASGYTHKSLKEKLAYGAGDPYDPDFDEELPPVWPRPDADENGNLKDLAGLAVDAAGRLSLSGLAVTPYETSIGTIRLPSSNASAFLGSFDPANYDLKKTIQPLTGDDLTNILENLDWSPVGSGREKFGGFFDNVEVSGLKLPSGWRIPLHLYPKEGILDVVAVMRQGQIFHMIADPDEMLVRQIKDDMQEGVEIVTAPLKFKRRQPFLIVDGKELPAKTAPLFLGDSRDVAAEIDKNTLEQAQSSRDIQFSVEIPIHKAVFEGQVPFRGVKIAGADFCDPPKAGACWAYESGGRMVLPSVGSSDGILLPKNLRDDGVRAGDRGMLAYHAPTASAIQEQLIPIHVAGFYDPGVLSVGGRLAWVNPEIVAATSAAPDKSQGRTETGINVRFYDWSRAEEAKKILQDDLAKQGIDRYWSVETFRDFPMTKDMLQQLRSEKNLFSLISIVIIIVACSNIVSMLIILVNDKKAEIGILRSMGASSKSIAAIFGFCGMVMGLLGSLIGIALAALTLKNIQGLIALISHMQGHELFNAHFFGDVIPDQLSGEALGFVLVATVAISLISGVIPAIKASMMRPSAILRSE